MITGNLRAAALMTGSMALFSIEDAIVKGVTRELPVGQILLTFGVLGTVALLIAAWLRREAVWVGAFWSPGMVTRNLAEMVAAISFVCSLAYNSLSMVSALLQALPLVVTMGAALFLREPVGWRRWTAICVGLAGTLIILRPGAEGFRPEAFWILLCVVAIAVRDLATRAAPVSVTTMQLATWGLLATLVAGALLTASGLGGLPRWPTPVAALALVIAVSLGLTGYFMLIHSVRGGDMSMVAPFRYSRLVFGIALGMAFFGERPDIWMVVGATLVIASGLYALMREARLARLARGRRTSNAAVAPL